MVADPTSAAMANRKKSFMSAGSISTEFVSGAYIRNVAIDFDESANTHRVNGFTTDDQIMMNNDQLGQLAC